LRLLCSRRRHAAADRAVPRVEVPAEAAPEV